MDSDTYPYYCFIEEGEFNVLWSINKPANAWLLDSWDGPWMVLKNLNEPNVTCRILPKHVIPLHSSQV